MDTFHRKHMSFDCYAASPLIRWLDLQKKYVTWSLSDQPISALAGPTENTSRGRYPLLCDVTIGTKNTAPALLVVCVLQAFPSNGFPLFRFYSGFSGSVYVAVA